MKLLLDTCAALWYWSGDTRLSSKAVDALNDPRNELIFHQVSYLEITLKYSLGKLALAEAPSLLVPKAIMAYGLEYASLSNRGIQGLEDLPFHHRDPFDRLLISHARHQGLVILSADGEMPKYDVPVLW